MLVNVACRYNFDRYIGIICEKNYKEKDMKIQFMILNKCTKCFSWPAHQQTCGFRFMTRFVQFLCHICMVFLSNIKNFDKVLTNIKHKLNVIDTTAYY